jgi:hypothetical protein
MRNSLPFLLLLLVWASSCKDKKTDFSGDTAISATDFVAVFPKINQGFRVADTNITKVADTLTIGYKAILQFVPDSVITGIVGKSKRLAIHPVGMIEKQKENYLLLSLHSQKTTHIVVLVMDKKYKFLAAKELLSDADKDGYQHSVSINREPTFLISREKTGAYNQLQFSRTGWVYTSSGVFMVVINDSNEGATKSAIINPIDTFPKKYRYSGDYQKNKKNFISIRDGHTTNTYTFFIHFEKEENCTGELKGEFKMKSANTAVFAENGDPCVIDFTFDGNEVTVKEQGSCGSHRGITCYFDDSFIKKREPRSGKKNK